MKLSGALVIILVLALPAMVQAEEVTVGNGRLKLMGIFQVRFSIGQTLVADETTGETDTELDNSFNTAMLEGVYGNDDGTGSYGLYVQAAYKLMEEKLEAMARFGVREPNLDVEDDVQRRLTAGANYYISGKNVMLSLNYILDVYQSDRIDSTSTIITEAQIWF